MHVCIYYLIYMRSYVHYLPLYICSNVQCGQLHCMSGDFQANPGISVLITTFTIGSDVCRFV